MSRPAWLSPDALAHLAGGALPPMALERLVASGLKGLGCSLCFHRVAAQPRPTDWQKGLSVPPDELDALIELLLKARPGPAEGWLTVSFDDGYADAADYLRTRAARFPQVEFTFFVCPEKLERRAGFRWDLAERSMRDGAPRDEALGVAQGPVDVATENARPELVALGDEPDYALATVEEVRELARQPNIKLGNHTNLHLSAPQHDEALVAEDYRRSTEAFTRLFGPPQQFAFPFGTPRHHFTPRHVELLRALGDFLVWTTEARPYRLEERTPAAVLPRFPVDGTRSARQTAGWVAARALDYRLRGRGRA